MASAAHIQSVDLRPVRYRYKTDNALGIHDEGEHIGFNAQEVERVLPEAVSRNRQGYRIVNNDPILWTMLNAIKTQQKTKLRNSKRRFDG